MPEPRGLPVIGTRGDRRSAAARASDLLPARFYDPHRGRDEPPAVAEARRRWRVASAIGDGPDPLAARELAEMTAPEPVPEPAAVPAPEESAPPAATRCGRCGYPEGTIGHQVSCGDQPKPAEPAPAVRCGACGYLTGTPGHKVTCG